MKHYAMKYALTDGVFLRHFTMVFKNRANRDRAYLQLVAEHESSLRGLVILTRA